MIIREIQPQDIPELLGLGEAMHAEGAFHFLNFSAGKVELFLERALTSTRHLCLVAEKGDNIVGGLLAVITPYWFGYDLVAEETALYVGADHRNGVAGSRLVKGFEKWAEVQGVKEVLTGTSAGIKTERVRKFYGALGYEPIGYMFKKRI